MVRAIICGVSIYQESIYANLNGVNKDLKKVKQSFDDIFDIESMIIGNGGYVSKEIFVSSMLSENSKMKSTNTEDTIIFYYAGHGKIDPNTGRHLLVFSDDNGNDENTLNTQQVIDLLNDVTSDNLILILDCCYSGAVSVNQITAEVQDSFSDIIGKGVDVLCACKTDQSAWENSISGGVFTNIMLESLSIGNNLTKGLKMNDWLEYIFLIEKQKELDPKKQKIVQRSNRVGDFFVLDSKKDPYIKRSITFSADYYDCIEVKPLHTGKYKRYQVDLIITKPCTLSVLTEEILKTKQKADRFETYQNKKAEIKHKNDQVTHLFFYVYLSEAEYVNRNWKYSIDWVDKAANREVYYDRSEWISNGLGFKENSSYNSLKKLHEEYYQSDEEIIKKGSEIGKNIINLMNKVNESFIRYNNLEISEDDFIQVILSLEEGIYSLYTEAGNLGFSEDMKITEWTNQLNGICGSAYNCTLFYNDYSLKNRNTKNRRLNFRMSINQYNEDLKKFSVLNKRIESDQNIEKM